MAYTNPISNAAGAGGEVLSPEVSAPVIAGVAKQSVILDIANVRPVTTATLKVPLVTLVNDPEFRDELAEAVDGGADYEDNAINVKSISQTLVISKENYEDALVNPATYLDAAVRKSIAHKIDAHAFGFGNGTAIASSKFDNKLSSTTASVTLDPADIAKTIGEAVELLSGNGYQASHSILSNSFQGAFMGARTTDKKGLYSSDFTELPARLWGTDVKYSTNLQVFPGTSKVVGYIVDQTALKVALRTSVEVEASTQASVGGVSLFGSHSMALNYNQRIGFRAIDLSRAVVKIVTASS